MFTHAADHVNDFWWETSLGWMFATGLLVDLEDAIATAAPAVERLRYGERRRRRRRSRGEAAAAKQPKAKKAKAKPAKPKRAETPTEACGEEAGQEASGRSRVEEAGKKSAKPAARAKPKLVVDGESFDVLVFRAFSQ